MIKINQENLGKNIIKKLKPDEKYVKRMKSKGFVQVKVWVPKGDAGIVQHIAKGLRDTIKVVK